MLKLITIDFTINLTEKLITKSTLINIKIEEMEFKQEKNKKS